MAEGGNAREPQQLAVRPKLLLAAYLIQLLVPAFILLDVAVALGLGYVEFRVRQFVTGLAAACFLWLAVCVLALSFARDRDRYLRKIAKPLMSLYALLFCLFLAELVCRVTLASKPFTLTVWPPGSKWVSQIEPDTFPGVSGTKTFSVNEVGLRGPSLQGMENAYKIVTVGGSSTECLELDDSEEWPHLLMQKLNARQSGRLVWVGNAGVSGYTSVHHLMFLRSLPILRQVDMLIFMIGVNDLQASLAFEGASNEVPLEESASNFREFQIGFLELQPLYKRLRLYQLGKRATFALERKFKTGSWTWLFNSIPASRRERFEGPVVPLPDLQTGLKEYRQRVLALATECRSMRKRCLFLTQPTMWRSDLTSEEKRLLWSGYVGRLEKPKGYASAADMARATAAYNQVLLDVCAQLRLECLDLAQHVAKDITALFDHAHFNVPGARTVADRLADCILPVPPLAGTLAAGTPNSRLSNPVHNSDPDVTPPADWSQEALPADLKKELSDNYEVAETIPYAGNSVFGEKTGLFIRPEFISVAKAGTASPFVGSAH
jgi:lysophospholipase L1-like esterase